MNLQASKCPQTWPEQDEMKSRRNELTLPPELDLVFFFSPGQPAPYNPDQTDEKIDMVT